MSEISVELNAVSSVIKKCKTIQSGLKAEAASMVQKYDSLGSGWNDEKYRELGQIVHSCSNALKQPISELQRCEAFLQQLLKIISEYESISFSGNGSNGDSSIVEDAVLYALNSTSAQVRQWRSRLEEISARVEEFNRTNFGSYLSERQLNRSLRDTVRYETRASFNARGEPRNVLGYNDGHRSRVVVGTGHELQTTVHENLHQLSHNNGRSGIITTNSDGEECNRQVNEAITELLTRRTLGDDYGRDYSAYSSNRDAMAVLERVMGSDIICRAYFQNQPELLQNEIDGVLGYGHWDALSDSFERCVDGTEYEIAAGRNVRDHIINRYVAAVSSRNGGNVSWRSLLN